MAGIEGHPWLELMSPIACERRLTNNTVGRIGLIVAGDPEIFPVNYTFTDGVVVIRADPGTKLDTIATHPSVAFEIDGLDKERHNGWSVLIVGQAREVTDPAERRRLLGEAPDPWPGGTKDHVICIEPRKITGRYLHHGVDTSGL